MCTARKRISRLDRITTPISLNLGGRLPLKDLEITVTEAAKRLKVGPSTLNRHMPSKEKSGLIWRNPRVKMRQLRNLEHRREFAVRPRRRAKSVHDQSALNGRSMIGSGSLSMSAKLSPADHSDPQTGSQHRVR